MLRCPHWFAATPVERQSPAAPTEKQPAQLPASRAAPENAAPGQREEALLQEEPQESFSGPILQGKQPARQGPPSRTGKEPREELFLKRRRPGTRSRVLGKLGNDGQTCR